MTLCQSLVEEWQQTLVARLRHYIVACAACTFSPIGLCVSLAYEEMFVSLTAQKVDIRVVGLLIGEEHGVESCLSESCQYTLLVMQTVVVVGCSSGQEHRHTLVSGVRLRAHVAEHEQSVGCREQRIGWTIIAIQLEVARAGCLAYYEHIHLCRVLGMLRHCIEAEIGYIIIVMCRKRTLMHCQTQIIEHIDGIHIVLNVIFKLALLLIAFGISYVAAYEQQRQRQYQTQRSAYGKALKFAVDAHTFSPLPCRYCKQRQIEYEHACHGWHQIVEQFHSLSRNSTHTIRPTQRSSDMTRA